MQRFGSLALSLIVASVVGCGTHTPGSSSANPIRGAAITGHVHGGQRPISGATIQLYAVSAAEDGQASAPLLSALVKTNSQGAFRFTGDYTCPSYASVVYIVATSGNPGLTSGTNNTALSEMVALGQCDTAGSSNYLQLNEVTTVASVFAWRTS
jgi:hypothetical protein